MLTLHLRSLLNSLNSDFRAQVAAENIDAARGTLCALLGILAANQPRHAAIALTMVTKSSTSTMDEIVKFFTDAQRGF